MKFGPALLASALAACLLPASGCSPLADGTISLTDRTTVPFTLHGNHIYIRASIGGISYAFAFDTGGTESLTPELSERLHLTPVGQVEARGVGEDATRVDIVRVPRIELGSASLVGASFLVLPRLPLESPFRGAIFGGILGREFFRSLVVTIDYQNSKLTLTQPASFKADSASAHVPVSLRASGIPNIPASIDGHSGNFDVDAGSSQAVTVTQTFANGLGLASGLRAEIGRGVGGAMYGTVTRAQSLNIGGLTLHRPIVLVADSRGGVFSNEDFSGNLGSDVLRHFTVTLDVPGHTLYLDPNTNFARAFVFNRAGLTVIRSSAGWRVASVIDNSPAAKAGVLSGDVVLSLNGRDAKTLDMAAFRDMWYDKVGKRVSLTLTRNGHTFTKVFSLRELV
ncbi:MAG TPA: aspartyl protease family protein [Candidatus Tumulicola sp.]